jgi:protein phosphatase
MGTTMVSALIRDQQLYVANVGDSRAYLVNDLGFWQLTEDHSFVNDQIRAGMLKEENARSHAMKNVITRSVGFERDVTPDILIKTLVAGDKLLLCSDGLSGLVEDRRIAEICSNSKLPEIVPNLISEAKANGGDDNVTVLLLSVT